MGIIVKSGVWRSSGVPVGLIGNLLSILELDVVYDQLQRFCAFSSSLNTIARVVFRDPQLRLFLVRSRTLAPSVRIVVASIKMVSKRGRQAVLAKLCPPHNRSVREVAAKEGISEATLYNWRKQARGRGELYPDAGSDADGWSARDKFAAVVETAAMNESERSQYCRKRGLYPEQLAAWRRACEQANDWAQERGAQQVKADREQRRRIRKLERELVRKEKALAEAAALLTL